MKPKKIRALTVRRSSDALCVIARDENRLKARCIPALVDTEGNVYLMNESTFDGDVYVDPTDGSVLTVVGSGDEFIANPDGTFTCPKCLTDDQRETLGDADVEVWQVGSDGWIGQPVCAQCGDEIPVEINGNEPEEDQ